MWNEMVESSTKNHQFFRVTLKEAPFLHQRPKYFIFMPANLVHCIILLCKYSVCSWKLLFTMPSEFVVYMYLIQGNITIMFHYFFKGHLWMWPHGGVLKFHIIPKRLWCYFILKFHGRFHLSQTLAQNCLQAHGCYNIFISV